MFAYNEANGDSGVQCSRTMKQMDYVFTNKMDYIDLQSILKNQASTCSTQKLTEMVSQACNWEYVADKDMFELKLPATFSGTANQLFSMIECVTGLRPKMLKPVYYPSSYSKFTGFHIKF